MICVELGAGARPADGFLALDANRAWRPDVVASITHLPFADGSVDALRAVDALEHCSYRQTDAVLIEWARVCRPGASLFVQVPDAAQIMRWFMNNDDRLLAVPPDLSRTHLMGAQWRLLGGGADGKYVEPGGDWTLNCHGALFSQKSLHEALDRAEFNVTSSRVNGHPNILAECRRR